MFRDFYKTRVLWGIFWKISRVLAKGLLNLYNILGELSRTVGDLREQFSKNQANNREHWLPEQLAKNCSNNCSLTEICEDRPLKKVQKVREKRCMYVWVRWDWDTCLQCLDTCIAACVQLAILSTEAVGHWCILSEGSQHEPGLAHLLQQHTN